MQSVHLGPSRIATSQVGFGCAQICRLPFRRDRLAVLEAAYDEGVTHFDVARMYGLGEAESQLGEFAKGRRDQLTIATKFGIPLGAIYRQLVSVKPIVRAAVRVFPKLRKLARSGGVGTRASRPYTARGAEESLAESLRQLQAEYIDIFFLHEPAPGDHIDEDLFDWLEHKRQSGVIREYGCSGRFEDVVALGKAYPRLRRVTQFPSDPLNRNYEVYHRREDEGVGTFSGLSVPLTKLEDYLSRSNSGGIGANSKRQQLRDEFARHCMAENVGMNPDGVTLFSSTRKERVRMLAKAAASSPDVRDVQIRDFLVEFASNGPARHQSQSQLPR